MTATVTTCEITTLMHLLYTARGPLTAARIAQVMGLGGCRESQRRRVRAMVQRLRDEGEWIVATTFDGYWLTEEADVWRQYEQTRQISAKQILAEVGRRQRFAADRNGQGMLFAPKPATGIG